MGEQDFWQRLRRFALGVAGVLGLVSCVGVIPLSLLIAELITGPENEALFGTIYFSSLLLIPAFVLRLMFGGPLIRRRRKPDDDGDKPPTSYNEYQ